MKKLMNNVILLAIVMCLGVFSSCSSDDDDKKDGGGRTLTMKVSCDDESQAAYIAFDVNYEITVIDSDDINGAKKNVNNGWSLDVKCPADAVTLQFMADAKLTELGIAQGIKLGTIKYTVEILENGKVLESDNYFHVVTYGIY